MDIHNIFRVYNSMSMQHRNPTPFAHVRDISRLITYLEFAVLQPLHIVAFEISRPFSLRDNWDFSQSLFSSVTIDFAFGNFREYSKRQNIFARLEFYLKTTLLN